MLLKVNNIYTELKLYSNLNIHLYHYEYILKLIL